MMVVFKEKPILFNGEMVRAILAGRKTQTRRVIKHCIDKNFGCQLAPHEIVGEAHLGDLSNSPYGKVGDRLYVRETWAQPAALDPGPTVYRADYPACVPPEFENVPPADAITWKPSIHMPRSASRITLEITGVRIERLQSISNDDVEAEGINYCMEDSSTAAGKAFSVAEHYSIGGSPMPHEPETFGVIANFAAQRIQWESNPWVWVYEFKVVPANETKGR